MWALSTCGEPNEIKKKYPPQQHYRPCARCRTCVDGKREEDGDVEGDEEAVEDRVVDQPRRPLADEFRAAAPAPPFGKLVFCLVVEEIQPNVNKSRSMIHEWGPIRFRLLACTRDAAHPHGAYDKMSQRNHARRTTRTRLVPPLFDVLAQRHVGEHLLLQLGKLLAFERPLQPTAQSNWKTPAQRAMSGGRFGCVCSPARTMRHTPVRALRLQYVWVS